MAEIALYAPAIAILVSLTTMAVAAMGLRSKANDSYVRTLEATLQLMKDKVQIHDKEIAICIEARDTLQRENIELMRQLTQRIKRLENENGGSAHG